MPAGAAHSTNEGERQLTSCFAFSGTRYTFQVSAENRHGQSAESQTVTARTQEEAPASPPRNLEVIPTSSTALEITWDAPPFSHWNSELLSYKIGYKWVKKGIMP